MRAPESAAIHRPLCVQTLVRCVESPASGGDCAELFRSTAVQLQPGQAMAGAIRNARENVLLTLTPTIASAELAQGLVAAVARGVRVSVLLPPGAPLSLLWYARIDEWVAAGIPVFQREPDQISAAVCVVDDRWASIVFRGVREPGGRPVNRDTEVLLHETAATHALARLFHSQCSAALAVHAGTWPGPLGHLRWARHMSVKG